MKKIIAIIILSACLFACNKDNAVQTGCDIQRTYIANAAKLTLMNGIWGTVSSIEGDCMPVLPPGISSCTSCPVKRTIKIYEYTLPEQATASNNSTIFFDSFSTDLVATVDTDNDGFYQADIPPGHYTVAIVEDGKLYAISRDADGGLNPVIFTGGTMNVNLIMTYKAVF